MSTVEQTEAAGELLSLAVRATLIALEAEVERHESRSWDLGAQLQQSATNSSLPPSSVAVLDLTYPSEEARRIGQRF